MPETRMTATGLIEAPVEHVWQVLSDVERWPEWLPTVSSVRRLGGAPDLGADFEITQPKLRPAVWEVSYWEPPYRFDWVSRAPGVLTEGGHELAAEGTATRVTLSITQTGMVAALVRRVYGRLIQEYLDTEVAALTARAQHA